jgi:hypothetical protein
MTYQAGSLGKRVKGISKKKTTELINKSTPKNKLNRYTELFRSFAGNEITPVDSSLIGIITRTVRNTTIALHTLFVSLELLNITKIITPIGIAINTCILNNIQKCETEQQ